MDESGQGPKRAESIALAHPLEIQPVTPNTEDFFSRRPAVQLCAPLRWCPELLGEDDAMVPRWIVEGCRRTLQPEPVFSDNFTILTAENFIEVCQGSSVLCVVYSIRGYSIL